MTEQQNNLDSLQTQGLEAKLRNMPHRNRDHAFTLPRLVRPKAEVGATIDSIVLAESGTAQRWDVEQSERKMIFRGPAGVTACYLFDGVIEAVVGAAPRQVETCGGRI